MTDVQLGATTKLEPFEFRWPDGAEPFEAGWAFHARIAGQESLVRHGIGEREVYGRPRVHTVTWVDGEVQVEASSPMTIQSARRSSADCAGPAARLHVPGRKCPR